MKNGYTVKRLKKNFITLLQLTYNSKLLLEKKR